MSAGSTCPLCGVTLSDTARICARCSSRISSSANATQSLPPDPVTSELATRQTSAITSLNQTLDRVERQAELTGRIGRFEIRKWLGEGTFAEVYLAYDPKLQREVALKVAKPGTLGTPARVRRFLNEARNLGSLRHSNIVALHDFGEDGGRYYLVSEYVAGRTLGDAIDAAKDNRSILPFKESMRIVRLVAEALACAHERGIVHRDVKPDNIMVDESGAPLLMDFGLAVRAEREDGEERFTQSGIAVGTPAYMSPEQAHADPNLEIGAASDQYALSCTMFELLTGQTPFSGPPEVQLLLHKMQAPPSPRKIRKDVPRDLETLCLKCLEKKPADRLASIRVFAEELLRWEKGEAILTRPQSRREKLGRFLTRNRAKVAIAVVILFAALIGVSASWYFEYSRQLERQLRSGKAVTLVPDKGWPKWHTWHLGDAQPALSLDGDGAAGFQTHTTLALVLLRDPMNDSYRFSADLKHCRAHAEVSALGLFVVLTELPPTNGTNDAHWVAIRFSDFWSEAELKRPDFRKYHALMAMNVVTLRADLSAPLYNMKAFNFTPKHQPPPEWRTLVLDVSPNGLVVSCARATTLLSR